MITGTRPAGRLPWQSEEISRQVALRTWKLLAATFPQLLANGDQPEYALPQAGKT